MSINVKEFTLLGGMRLPPLERDYRPLKREPIKTTDYNLHIALPHLHEDIFQHPDKHNSDRSFVGRNILALDLKTDRSLDMVLPASGVSDNNVRICQRQLMVEDLTGRLRRRARSFSERWPQDMLAREKMINQAAQSTCVFSISIVPFAPDKQQLLYMKKSYGVQRAHELVNRSEDTCHSAAADTNDIVGFINGMLANFFRTDDEGLSCRGSSSNKRANPEKPNRLMGFVKPFPEFSSCIADPETTLSALHPAPFNGRGDVSALLDAAAVTNRAVLENILNAFSDDVHAKGLSLLLLSEERGLERLSLVKPD